MNEPPIPPSRHQAFLFWLKLGFVSFGGPAGQIAVMHEELVVRRRWISERRFLHALNYCMLLPGPEAQQLATYVGWLLHRTWGGVIAGGLFVLPSLFILIALSWGYMAYGHLPAIAAIFFGMKPAVVAIVVFAAWRIGRRVIRHWLLGLIAAAAFVELNLLGWPFPLVILGAAIIGGLMARVVPRAFKGPGATQAGSSTAPAVIDDDTPTPPHARASWMRCASVVIVGILLWTAAMAILWRAQGGEGLLPAMGLFFSKTALIGFGGAYAVLPYVYQAAVHQYGWLTGPQMIDGLALGETTPGPLVMVLAFVGYVGGWTHAAGVGLAPAMAGLSAAVVVTFFTFLPSFVFIFAGGPWVEASRNREHLTAPLTAVTAAVVGVIASLAVYFAMHVFWPGRPQLTPDWRAVGIAAVAGVALFAFRVSVVPVVLGAGALGLLLAS